MFATNTYQSIPEGPLKAPKSPRKGRPPRWFNDPKGGRIIHVPLKHGGSAIVDAFDFDSLKRDGISARWCLNDDGKGNAYVRVVGKNGTMVTVARLILNAPPGRMVRYRDHNPLNIRRNNLVLDGVSKRQEATAAAAARRGPTS